MSSRKRVLIIGIDGATFDLIGPWMEEGSLPNLAAIARNGASGVLQSTLPPNSAPAWTSFMTGMNPGKHGVYGFTRVEPSKGYAIKTNTGAIRRAQTIWQLLTEHRRRSIVLNVPMTYPPDAINGLVVTGIATPGLESQFTHPPEFRHEVFRLIPNYTLDVRSWGVTAAGERRARILDDIQRMVESRRKLALHLLTTQPWDLFTVVFTASDRVQHFFWRFLDPSHPLYDPAEAPIYHDAILRVHRQIDEALGEMLACCGDETTVIVMSDHGFGPQKKLFRINQWLVDNGFLRLIHTTLHGPASHLTGIAQKWSYRGLDKAIGLARASLSDTAKDRLKRLFPRLRERVASVQALSMTDWAATRAYHTSEISGGIRVNLRGRETKGIVEPGPEYESVCGAIKSALERFVDPDTGKRVVEQVFQRDELYWGSYVDLAPDLTVHLADYSYTFDYRVPVVRDGARGDLPVTDALSGEYAANCGYHRLSGILMLYGPDIRNGVQLDPAQIYDITATTLYLLELPIPADMDGQVLREAFKADLLEHRAIEHGVPTSPVTEIDSFEVLSEAEAELVNNRLRDLGYL